MRDRVAGLVLGVALALGPVVRPAAAQNVAGARTAVLSAGAMAEQPSAPAWDSAAGSGTYRRKFVLGVVGSMAGTAAGYGTAYLLDRAFGTGEAPAFVGVIVGSVAGTALGTRAGARRAGGRGGSLWAHVGAASVGLLAGAGASTALRHPLTDDAALVVFPLVQAAVAALLSPDR